MKRVSAGILNNGFRFYTQHDTRSQVFGIGVRAGSIHDPSGKSGMSHLTEHVLARYSREEELKFEECGCGPDEDGINIRTDYVSVFYGHNILLRREYTAELRKIIIENIRNPKITSEALETERAAVLNEYFLRGEDDVEDVVETLMHREMYERNPARNRVDCELGELKSITCADMRQFIRVHYAPNNMFAVVIGPSFQKVKRLCDEYFGELKRFPDVPMVSNCGEARPIFQTPKCVEIERPGIHQYHVAIGFPTNPYGSKDDEALDVLASIWAFRLRLALRDGNREWGKGTYRVLAFTPRSKVHGMIYAWFATWSGASAREGAERIIRECDALKRDWVPDDELAAMRNKLWNIYVDDFNNAPEELCERIIEAAANGDEDMRRLNSYLGRLARVGKKRLNRVANEYFTPGYLHLLLKPSNEISLP